MFMLKWLLIMFWFMKVIVFDMYSVGCCSWIWLLLSSRVVRFWMVFCCVMFILKLM